MDEEDRAAILGGNAARLFGLSRRPRRSRAAPSAK